MSGGMPELGSKISLISKADIRYEGRLYTVDPQECTIALSSVRSFGTEDRDTQFQIAPQSQIYDYILFRGSDIKDIRVINNLPHPNDPAIMQVQLQNGQQLMPHFPMPNMNAPGPQMAPGSYPFGGMTAGLGAIGAAVGSSAAVGNPMAPGSGPGPGPFMMGNQQQQQQPQPHQQQQHHQQKPQQPLHKQENELPKQPEQMNQQNRQQQLPLAQPSEELKNKMPAHASSNPTNNIASGNRIPVGTGTPAGGLLSSVIAASGGGGGGANNTGGGFVSDINALGNSNTIVQCSSSAASASVSTKKLLSNAAARSEPKNKDQVSVLDMITGGSRSTTPDTPPPMMGMFKKQQQQQQQSQQHQQQQQQPHHNQMQHHSNQNAGHGPNGGNKRQNQNQNQHQQQQPPQQRSGNNQQPRNNDFYTPQQQQQHQQQHQQQQQQRPGGGRIQPTNQQQQQQHHDMRNNYNNQRNNNQGGGPMVGGGPSRNWTMHRGNVPNVMMRNRGGGRGRMPNQGFRQMGVPGGVNNKNNMRMLKTVIKFEQDFDFEQANNKFEELRSQLAKLKVGDEPKTEQQINGETDKKDDSGNETGAGEHEHEDDEITVGYDKTKSFFDNISCETAQDRSKNKKNDWRQERKLNSETFGVSSTRRGSYRGRNNYYNRSIGNYNGGNRGYRPAINYRNRNNNNNNRNNTTGAASKDSNNGDETTATTTNNNNNNNNNNTATSAAATTNTSKSQPTQQQPQTTGSASAATAVGNPTKAILPAPQGTNTNTNNQPQVTAGGE